MRVPVYESSARSAGLPVPTLRPAPIGTDELGAGVQRLGSAALQIATAEQDRAAELAKKERDRADAFRVDGADLEWGKALNSASWGDDGFLHAKGENALDYSARAEGLEKERQRIAGGLASDRQRELFQRRAVARLEQTREAWEKHSSGQRTALFGQVAEGQAQLALDEAATAYADPDAVHSALQKVLHDPDGGPGVLVRYLRDVKGLPQEAIERAVTQFQREGYKGALNRYLAAEDVDGAKKFLERFGEAMGPAADAARKTIALEATKRAALSTAELIVSSARDGEMGWVDETKALAALDEIPDEKKRNEARTFVLQGIVDAKNAQKAQTAEVFKGALSAYNRGGLRAIPAETMGWLNRNAPDLERKLRDDAERRWRQTRGDAAEARREQAETDARIERTFLGLSAEERARTDLDGWDGRTGASEASYKRLQILQNSARKDVESGDASREAEFRRDGFASAAGVVKSKKEREALGAELTNAFSSFRDDHKRFPTREEAQKLQDDLLLRVTRERSILPDTEEFEFQRRARERQAALKGGAPAAPTAPAGKPASEAPRQDKLARAQELRARGLTFDQIADALNTEGY